MNYTVDEQGRKHYRIECETGHLGMDLSALGSEKNAAAPPTRDEIVGGYIVDVPTGLIVATKNHT